MEDALALCGRFVRFPVLYAAAQAHSIQLRGVNGGISVNSRQIIWQVNLAGAVCRCHSDLPLAGVGRRGNDDFDCDDGYAVPIGVCRAAKKIERQKSSTDRYHENQKEEENPRQNVIRFRGRFPLNHGVFLFADAPQGNVITGRYVWQRK